MTDVLDKALKEFKAADDARAKALERLHAIEHGPRIIDASDSKALSENMQALAEGTAIAVRNPGRKRRAPHANEILKTDTERLTKHFEQIKSGLMIVIDENDLPYEAQ